MVMKAVTFLLVLATTSHGASIVPLDLVDNLQELLINPDALGMRMKRDVSDEWDKELDLDLLGLSYKIKYNDPTNPLKGGHAHVKFPGKRFIKELTFDDVDLEIVFNGGDAVDGIFDMKVDYKFVQKFAILADRPQEGSFTMYRKLEGGVWKTKINIHNTRQPQPFFDVTIDSDRKTFLHAKFQYEDDNKWEMRWDYVPDNTLTGVFNINGKEHTVVGTRDTNAKKLNVKLLGFETTYNMDFQVTHVGDYGITVKGQFMDAPVDVLVTIKPDFKNIDLVVKYNNINYAFIKLTGDLVHAGWIPMKADYNMKYNIGSNMMEGKAKINFDAGTPKKTLKISFVPKGGLDLTLDSEVEVTVNNGWKAQHETTRGGVSYFKWVQEYDILANNANKFNAHTKDEITINPESMFYGLFCSYIGKCVTTATRTRNINYDKHDRNFLLGKILYDDTAIVDGERFQHVKLDTSVTPYTLTWYRPTGPYWFYNTQSLFGLDEVEVKVWHTVGQEVKVETNVHDMKLTVRRDPDYFVEFIRDGETMLKFHTEITPATIVTEIDTLVYLPHNIFHRIMEEIFCSFGQTCFNKREAHLKIVIDRQNKNALLNKFSVESNIKKDNFLVLDISMSTMTAPYTFHLSAPTILPNVFHDPSRKTIEATINHVIGDHLEIKSNCPELETFKITTSGDQKTVTVNGEELTVVEHKNGEKRFSQTTDLPNGEHLTTTVEWTTNMVKKNKVVVTAEWTPDRKLEAAFDWDFRKLQQGNVDIDVKGDHPWVGNYHITRKGNWKSNKRVFNLNWEGNAVMSSGPFSALSPIQTTFKVHLNKPTMKIDANIIKTIGGKQWGFKVAKNKFSILAGRG